jgi:hypothetical protein
MPENLAMMFKPLSDALGLVLALSLAGPDERAATLAETHAEAPTRWGRLAVDRDGRGGARDGLSLDGRPVPGVESGTLWIVRVEPVSPEADRAVIAAGDGAGWPPTRFSALTITRDGARLETGGIELRLRGTALSR